MFVIKLKDKRKAGHGKPSTKIVIFSFTVIMEHMKESIFSPYVGIFKVVLLLFFFVLGGEKPTFSYRMSPLPI